MSIKAHLYKYSQLNPQGAFPPAPLPRPFSVSLISLPLILTSLCSDRPFSDQHGLEWIPCGIHQLLSVISLVEPL